MKKAAEIRRLSDAISRFLGDRQSPSIVEGCDDLSKLNYYAAMLAIWAKQERAQ